MPNLMHKVNFDPLREFLKQGALIQTAPNQVDIFGGNCEWFSKKPQSSTPALYAPDFFLKTAKPWLLFEHHRTMNLCELSSFLRSLPCRPEDITFYWHPPLKDDFREIFSMIKNKIQGHFITKTVPVVFEYSFQALTLGGLKNIICSSLDRNVLKNLYLYGFWDPYGGVLGVTPEKLFSFQHTTQRLQSMALAGTTACSQSDRDFLTDAKQLHEHRLVVDDLRERLELWGDVRISRMGVVKFALLHHLLTPIEVVVRDEINLGHSVNSRTEEFVKHLHPTGALGGIPRGPSFELLQDLDIGNERGRFGAPFAIARPNQDIDCLVAIRNIQWNHRGVRMGAGCGIVEESEWDSEWEELRLKLDFVRQLLWPLPGSLVGVRQ